MNENEAGESTKEKISVTNIEASNEEKSSEKPIPKIIKREIPREMNCPAFEERYFCFFFFKNNF